MTKKQDAEVEADNARWEAVEEATELIHEERFHDALVALREVLKDDPRNAYAFYFLAIVMYESGEIEAARDAYQACLKLAPSHLGARVALTHVLRALGDLRGAIKEGMTALSQQPGDADALHAVGLAYYARGDKEAARKYLGAFLATKTEFEVATEVRAMLDALDAPNA
jgi:thioredoxin-like negative regulator of GroEL